MRHRPAKAGPGTPQELLLELFGHGLGDMAGAPSEPSLVEQFERGMFTTLAFYEAVAKAGGASSKAC